jgi:hypothetical protein
MVSDFVKNSCQGTVTFIARDSTGANVELELDFDLGDVSLTGLKKKLNEYVRMQRRGRKVSTNFGNRTFPQLSLSVYVTSLTSSGDKGSASEFCLQRGAYEDNVGVDGAGRPYAIDVRVNIEGSDFDDDEDIEFTCLGCLPEMGFGEAMDGDKATFTFDVDTVEGDLAAGELDD